MTSLPVSAVALQNITAIATPAPVARTSLASNAAIMKVAIGIIVLALLGGEIFAWLGSQKKKNFSCSVRMRGAHSS